MPNEREKNHGLTTHLATESKENGQNKKKKQVRFGPGEKRFTFNFPVFVFLTRVDILYFLRSEMHVLYLCKFKRIKIIFRVYVHSNLQKSKTPFLEYMFHGKHIIKNYATSRIKQYLKNINQGNAETIC
jgi:hypothetical protein